MTLMMNSLYIALLYCLANVLVAGLCAYFIPKNYERSRILLFAFFLVLTLFIPIIGIVISIMYTIHYHQIDKHVHQHNIDSVVNLSYQSEISAHSHKFGAGGARVRLTDTRIPVQKRVEALLALNLSKNSFTNHLMQQSLHDKNDEVRLLAFAMLDDQNKAIHSTIDYLGLKLRLREITKADPISIARLEKRLAFAYWELAYLGLVQGNLQKHAITQSKTMANKALKAMPDDARLHVLTGLQYMSEDKLELARTALRKGLACGIAAARVIPYLAELEYKARNLGKVKEYLSHYPELQDIPRMAAVMKYWEAL